MRRPPSRRRLHAAAVSLLALATIAGAPARGAAQWVVARDPVTELWFHGLALARFPGQGPLAMYAASPPRDARAGPPPEGARLAAAAGALRIAASRDSALEVLHFLPLYFAGAAPEAVLGALRIALTEPARPAGASAVAARAAAAAAAIPPARRALVRAFVDALDDEWRGLSRAERLRRAPEPAHLAALQRAWEDTLAPALGDYLARVGCERGAILVVPALGAEGRIVAFGGGRRLVAVADDDDAAEPLAPLLLAVKELAYPLLDAVDPALLPTERVREAAAARAGALLLAAARPALAERYRRLLARHAGAGFETAFPASPALDSALRAAVSRTTPPNGGR